MTNQGRMTCGGCLFTRRAGRVCDVRYAAICRMMLSSGKYLTPQRALGNPVVYVIIFLGDYNGLHESIIHVVNTLHSQFLHPCPIYPPPSSGARRIVAVC
jgi:hypothetical protein